MEVSTQHAEELKDSERMDLAKVGMPLETVQKPTRIRSAKTRDYGGRHDQMMHSDDDDFENDINLALDEKDEQPVQGYYDEDEEDEPGDEALYSKRFVNAFFGFQDIAEAGQFMVRWFRDLKHNPTEFTADLPALLEKGLEYRNDVVAKMAENPNVAAGLGKTVMSQCIIDYGMFQEIELQNPEDRPNEHDYLLHLVLNVLLETCGNDRTPTILPRIILNNLAMKLLDNEIKLEVPRHQ